LGFGSDVGGKFGISRNEFNADKTAKDIESKSYRKLHARYQAAPNANHEIIPSNP